MEQEKTLTAIFEDVSEQIFDSGMAVARLLANEDHFHKFSYKSQDGENVTEFIPKTYPAEIMLNKGLSRARMLSYFNTSFINNLLSFSAISCLGFSPAEVLEFQSYSLKYMHKNYQDAPTTIWELENFLHMNTINANISLKNHATNHIKFSREVDWDSKPIRRDSFDYVPGDRPQPKPSYKFWK